MSIGKLALNNDVVAEEFFSDARLIGIICPVKDYQFGWRLNQELNYDFRLNNELEIQLSKKQRKYYFSVFEFREVQDSFIHYLYNNHFDGEYLLPEFRHLDFLWMIKSKNTMDEIVQKIENALRTVSGVQWAMEIKADKIKNKQHLVL